MAKTIVVGHCEKCGQILERGRARKTRPLTKDRGNKQKPSEQGK